MCVCCPLPPLSERGAAGETEKSENRDREARRQGRRFGPLSGRLGPFLFLSLSRLSTHFDKTSTTTTTTNRELRTETLGRFHVILGKKKFMVFRVSIGPLFDYNNREKNAIKKNDLGETDGSDDLGWLARVCGVGVSVGRGGTQAQAHAQPWPCRHQHNGREQRETHTTKTKGAREGREHTAMQGEKERSNGRVRESENQPKKQTTKHNRRRKEAETTTTNNNSRRGRTTGKRRMTRERDETTGCLCFFLSFAFSLSFSSLVSFHPRPHRRCSSSSAQHTTQSSSLAGRRVSPHLTRHMFGLFHILGPPFSPLHLKSPHTPQSNQ